MPSPIIAALDPEDHDDATLPVAATLVRLTGAPMTTGTTSAPGPRRGAGRPGEEHESPHLPAEGTQLIAEQRARPERQA